ncbi:hypothetical protein SAMN05216496_4719 [Pseudomonas sp. Z003-0.4C(8344-21)]|uniref:hypothetical protein n=1 Tax=Pseudomonas sp. Z003-0.4C(8344-21) TaxID=1855380 RepID=UPI000879933F|nr:hypothetical protein [Pseudomonas sp. Z003-0.4C(8344-21)]SDT46260.1 hypothetical protein SAMN05216496_4719 [Pseudomonas sp. Z003-0.4C(8344-21)]
MSNFGLLVRNAGGATIIDSKFHNLGILLEQNIAVTTSTVYQLAFPYPVTSAAPPILAVRAWDNPALFYDSVQYLGGPGNWTGAVLAFIGNGGHTSQNIAIRVYAYNLRSVSGYGMRVRNELGVVVFDSLLRPPVFERELGGAPQDWILVSGQPIAGAARMDIYRPATWITSSNTYLAVGMALDVELGQVAVNGVTVNAITYIRWGFAANGEPRLMLDSRTGFNTNYPGIPQAIYYSMPAIPIIKE